MIDGIDLQLDTIGVILEETFYCGSCNLKMEKIGNKKYKCGKCGEVYVDR